MACSQPPVPYDTLLKHMIRPVVIVTTDNNSFEGHASFTVTKKYLDPVTDIMEALPLMLPPMGLRVNPQDVLDHADGLLVTGAPSNIEPHHYGQTPEEGSGGAAGTDAERDAVNLPLIRAALARGVPVMGICRGFQEINVALGGTLHQSVHTVAGFDDHRADKSAPVEKQYGPTHSVTAVADGWLEKLVGRKQWQVNSVHMQGLDRLAAALLPQAHAPDGLVEAFSLRSGASFLLGVQWHPEWEASRNPVSVRLFSAFADACRDYAKRRVPAEKMVKPET